LTNEAARRNVAPSELIQHRPGGSRNAKGQTVKTANTTTTTDARLYVGTYAKYNNGNLAGAWLNLADYADQDEFLTAAREVHADEADPELMFQDFEGFPRAWYAESSAPPAILWEWLELDEAERLAFGAYADHMGGPVEVRDFRNAYAGQWDRGADFAEHIAEECGGHHDLPTWLVIDWETSWKQNLRHDYFEADDADGSNHIFRNT
jgi:antirestriction protein